MLDNHLERHHVIGIATEHFEYECMNMNTLAWNMYWELLEKVVHGDYMSLTRT